MCSLREMGFKELKGFYFKLRYSFFSGYKKNKYKMIYNFQTPYKLILPNLVNYFGESTKFFKTALATPLQTIFSAEINLRLKLILAVLLCPLPQPFTNMVACVVWYVLKYFLEMSIPTFFSKSAQNIKRTPHTARQTRGIPPIGPH